MDEIVVRFARGMGPDVLAAIFQWTFPRLALFLFDPVPVFLVKRGCVAARVGPGILLLRDFRCGE